MSFNSLPFEIIKEVFDYLHPSVAHVFPLNKKDRKYYLKYYKIEKGYTRELLQSIDFLHYYRVIPPINILLTDIIKHLGVKSIKWCKDNNCEWNQDTCNALVKIKKYKELQYCVNNNCDFYEDICIYFINNNDMNMLTWLLKYIHIDIITDYVAKHGTIEMLRWCKNNGCTLNKSLFVNVVKRGDYEMFYWCVNNECPWNTFACITAAMYGHFEMIKWFVDNGCIIDNDVCNAAKNNNYNDIYDFCIKQPNIINKTTESLLYW